ESGAHTEAQRHRGELRWPCSATPGRARSTWCSRRCAWRAGRPFPPM
ncbi:MAG: hypothetical protein AVDCRST_MAG68-5581, partial [uncultured Gemmatimonadetes bacterium]